MRINGWCEKNRCLLALLREKLPFSRQGEKGFVLWVRKMKAKKAGVCALVLMCTVSAPLAKESIPDNTRAAARNMKLVGYNDLQGRSAFLPVIVEQGGRWLAYVGHQGGEAVNSLTGKKEGNGTSILDVTDPRRPKYLHHIPTESREQAGSGGEGSGALAVQVCAGKDLPKGERGKFYMLRSVGRESQEMWDVTDPANPARIAVVVDKLKSTHVNWWECDTGIAYINAGLPDWQVRRITQVYDLSDPVKPVLIRNFGLPGQQPGAPKPPSVRWRDGHGPFSTGPQGNRLYFGYGNIGDGAFQIVDRQKLLTGPPEPTAENLLYPQIAFMSAGKRQAVHGVYPLLGMDIAEFAKSAKGRVRDFLLVMPEAIESECREEPQMMFVVDITNETEPFGVGNFRVPEKLGNFCTRGARFGAHSANTRLTPIFHKRVVFVAWFNAGVRAVDVRNPFELKEIGYYVPATTRNTAPSCVKEDGRQHCKTAIVTNAVEVDDRGYIYIADRNNTGMHILELTGAARKVANFGK